MVMGNFHFPQETMIFSKRNNGTVVNECGKGETYLFRFTIIYTQTLGPSLLKGNPGSINCTLILFLPRFMDKSVPFRESFKVKVLRFTINRPSSYFLLPRRLQKSLDLTMRVYAVGQNLLDIFGVA
jgi:hypothetical protein